MKINKCPALAPRNTLDEPAIERIGIDLDACDRHWAQLKQDPGFARRVARAYSRKEFSSASDVDLMLYDGFLQRCRTARCRLVYVVHRRRPSRRCLSIFATGVCPRCCFVTVPGTWPETLSEEDRQRWEVFSEPSAPGCRRRRQHYPGRLLRADCPAAYRA